MRVSDIIGFLLCIGGLVVAYFFLELYQNLEPCPLCILDRIVLAAMAVVFFANFFLTSIQVRIATLGSNLLLLACGFLFAGRHIWLQNRPFDPRSECLASAPEIKGMVEFFAQAFDAQADCSLIAWHVFSLTIPDLTLALFICILILLGLQGFGIYVDSTNDADSND